MCVTEATGAATYRSRHKINKYGDVDECTGFFSRGSTYRQGGGSFKIYLAFVLSRRESAYELVCECMCSPSRHLPTLIVHIAHVFTVCLTPFEGTYESTIHLYASKKKAHHALIL